MNISFRTHYFAYYTTNSITIRINTRSKIANAINFNWLVKYKNPIGFKIGSHPIGECVNRRKRCR